MAERSRDTTLRIVACRQAYSGVNPRGHRYTIFDVSATRLDGTLIDEKLRSFEALPIGQEIEVSVTPFESEAHGRSFTLHRKVSAKEGRTEQVNELTAEVEQLRGRVETLTAEVQTLTARIEKLESTPRPASAAPQAW